MGDASEVAKQTKTETDLKNIQSKKKKKTLTAGAKTCVSYAWYF